MNIKKIFQKKQTPLKYSFNVDKVRDVALEGKQKINEKAERWIEDNWIEQNILEAAALGKYSYTFNKVPKELAEYVGSYFRVRGFSVIISSIPPRGQDNGTRTMQVIW